jgi:hydroxypyruvate reductase
LFGGETTVRVTGDGLGGRNQELALRVALLGHDLPFSWTFLSGGTDGRDGPTDAAGGIVDQTSWRRMRSLGIDAFQALSRSDSYHALQASGDLLVTGATGTNVADLQIFLKA